MSALLLCPQCGSDRVAVAEVTKIMVNTLEHWCHSVKAGDDDAQVSCLECEWEGVRVSLIIVREGGAA